MQDQLKQIAERIRDVREIEGVAAETLARELEVPLEAYLAYESGETDIPVSLLYLIAQRFDVTLTALLTGEEPKLRMCALVRKGKGLAVERRKEYQYESLGFNFQHRKAEPFLVTVSPEPEGTPVTLNSHSGQEFNYVLEGTMQITVGGRTLVLEAGDSLYFDAAQPHGMQALHGQTTRFLAIIM